MSAAKKNKTDDKAALWAQLQEIHQKETEELNEEKQRLEKEKETMGGISADPSDILEINAGGQAIIQCHRRTLCLASDSMFSHLFSGRWDDSCARDSNGRVFLDHDPELIQLIVNHLRGKRIEDPSNVVLPPNVPEGKKREWFQLLRYFGLHSFIYPTSDLALDCSRIELVQPHGTKVTKTLARNDQSLQLHYNSSSSGHHFVACKPSLRNGQPEWWKVTVNELPNGHWLYLGIIGNLQSPHQSYSEGTSYGWAGSGQVYYKGKNRQGESGWTKFVQGECLFFHFQGNSLNMFSNIKDQVFTLDGITNAETYHIHFNIYDVSTKVTLAPMTDNEIQTLTLKL